MWAVTRCVLTDWCIQNYIQVCGLFVVINVF